MLGKETGRIKIINIGRLSIYIRGFSPFLGFVNWNASGMNKFQTILAVLGGPLLSLIMSVSLILFSSVTTNYLMKQILIFSAIYHLFQFIVTFTPIHYPKWWRGYEGLPSDGYRVFKLISETSSET